MASTQVGLLKPYATGSTFKYPVIIKCPYDPAPYINQAAIKDSSELAIGDLAIINTDGLLDASTDANTVRPVLILDTVHNKTLFKARGVTPTKLTQFATGEKVDYILLVPGMIVSLKVSYAQTDEADLLYGYAVKCGHTPTHIELLAVSATDEPAAKIGVVLDDITVGNTLVYAPVLIC